jgi:hypothetical protein
MEFQAVACLRAFCVRLEPHQIFSRHYLDIYEEIQFIYLRDFR